MIQTVQVSEFRNNLAEYLGKLDEGWDLEIKKGSEYVGKLAKHPKTKIKPVLSMDKWIEELKKWRKDVKSRIEAKDMEELVNEIDRVVYGVDRNGEELSD